MIYIYSISSYICDLSEMMVHTVFFIFHHFCSSDSQVTVLLCKRFFFFLLLLIFMVLLLLLLWIAFRCSLLTASSLCGHVVCLYALSN